MAKNRVVQQVCEEPRLYAFAQPQRIASALAEYAIHLRSTQPASHRRHTELLVRLGEALAPLDAPLVALTPALAQSLVSPAALAVGTARSALGSHQLMTELWTFFRWAEHRGYVTQNPFDPLLARLINAQAAANAAARYVA